MSIKSIFNIVLFLIIGIIISCVSCKKNEDTILSSATELTKQIATDLEGYKIAFGDTRNIYMMNPDGSNVELLADASPISGYVSWSPDAKYVYYASAKGPAETAWEAWRVHIGTKEATKISNFGLDVRSLGVSPDNQILAISVMTGNSNVGNNNNNLTQFSTNLYTVSMAVVESKIANGEQIGMADLTAIQSSPNADQFWYEELNWNHDANNPLLAYTKTWRYDEDDVSYTHVYTIKPDGSENKLLVENQDQPIWSIDNTKLSFLRLTYYDFTVNEMKNLTVTGINKEVSGGSFSPLEGNFMVFEVGDENRKGGIAKTTEASNVGEQLITGNTNVYEPRWSPVKIN
ncbi:TolB family protein [Tenacibaculum amylolyticum]|uniref:TolB family protein n=1 Tax=Tenacibaculum amylolyticum TaxID=104269 RepID=UPI003895EE3F